MRYKTQIPGVRMTVRRVIFDDPAEAAAATERWNSSASTMLELLERYEAQVLGMPAVKDKAWIMISSYNEKLNLYELNRGET